MRQTMSPSCPLYVPVATVTVVPFVAQALFVYYNVWLLCFSMYNVY